MTSQKTTQTMKPATAAKKLGVYLEATPAEFQEGVVTRDELNALQTDPPEWESLSPASPAVGSPSPSPPTRSRPCGPRIPNGCSVNAPPRPRSRRKPNG